ncbi:hypothetical protein H6P81_014421 [Aristolochia fimbriata]|uniref:IST1-like protein n=1 Tax=Aristolochia fimbriata TaxID=158543 RepID=A0AAV7EM23_ARIFI|nr:hypothetical protein H6P81_014421 [Aristolochia fimbriata]
MLEFLFGWRKATKCKDLIRCVRCRLKLLRNKRFVMVRQLREDIAQLLSNGHRAASTFSRVEELFKAQSILSAYDLLDHFCEFIIINLSYIRKHRDCPNDINEAVSSLIFAAARCADLPELQVLRKLFGERYGIEFAVAAVELLPGNHVNRQISEHLSVKSVSDDAKWKLLNEVARDSNLQQADIPTLKKSDAEWGKDLLGGGIQVLHTDFVRHDQYCYKKNMVGDQKEILGHDNARDHLSSNFNKMGGSPCGSCGSSDMAIDSVDVPRKCSPDDIRVANMPEVNTGKDEGWTSLTLSDSGPHSYSEKQGEVIEKSREGRPISGSRNSSKKRKSSRPVSKWRSLSKQSNIFSVCTENNDPGHLPGRRRRSLSGNLRNPREALNSRALTMKDLESFLYYDDVSDSSDVENPVVPVKKTDTHKRTKPDAGLEGSKNRTSRMPKGKSRSCSFGGGQEKTPSHQCKYNGRRSFNNSSNQNMGCECCLDHPCYFFASDVDEEIIKASPSWDSSPSIEMLRHATTAASRSHSPVIETKVAGSRKTEQPGGQVRPAPYTRAMTMPIERSKVSGDTETLRCSSFGHVHPKLPDYDELAAKFTALKKEHRERYASPAPRR